MEIRIIPAAMTGTPAVGRAARTAITEARAETDGDQETVETGGTGSTEEAVGEVETPGRPEVQVAAAATAVMVLPDKAGVTAATGDTAPTGAETAVRAAPVATAARTARPSAGTVEMEETGEPAVPTVRGATVVTGETRVHLRIAEATADTGARVAPTVAEGVMGVTEGVQVPTQAVVAMAAMAVPGEDMVRAETVETAEGAKQSTAVTVATGATAVLMGAAAAMGVTGDTPAPDMGAMEAMVGTQTVILEMGAMGVMAETAPPRRAKAETEAAPSIPAAAAAATAATGEMETA